LVWRFSPIIHAHGQGHDTTFAQIAADGLGLPLELIHLRHGDTAQGPAMACGTYGSRSLAVGGMAVHKACREVVSKARKLAAHLFEAAEEDMVFEAGAFHVESPALASFAILEMCVSIARWFRDGGELSPDAVADEYSGFALQIAGCPGLHRGADG